MSVNKVQLLGRLGQDPELKYTPGGPAVCNFTLATSESWTDKSGKKQEKTEWHRVVVWGKLAELCNMYLSKGRQAYVEGRLKTRGWDDKQGNKRYTTEINAKEVQFLDSKNESDVTTTRKEVADAVTDFSVSNIKTDKNYSTDEIPF